MENFLNIFLLGDVPNDLVSFTFFIGTMAMMAASVFFFLSLDAGGGKWRTSMLVSGLITFIAAVHYYYMRDANVAGADTTFFRYVDWILTVPLMCVEFYLILAKAGATKKLMWNLIFLSTVMLVAGYIGETGDQPVVWGTISGVAYFYMVYMLWLGEHEGVNLSENPSIILLSGLQGSGKTTFGGKLANYLKKKKGKNPLLVACDVYRPASICLKESLSISTSFI